jgi:hypothetical protein
MCGWAQWEDGCTHPAIPPTQCLVCCAPQVGRSGVLDALALRSLFPADAIALPSELDKGGEEEVRRSPLASAAGCIRGGVCG